METTHCTTINVCICFIKQRCLFNLSLVTIYIDLHFDKIKVCDQRKVFTPIMFYYFNFVQQICVIHDTTKVATVKHIILVDLQNFPSPKFLHSKPKSLS